MEYLKLIRPKNLLLIAVTQFMMRYAVIIPILKYEGFESQFSHLSFLLLVLSTVLLAAAGYVINDYFDTQTDILNRPKSVIIGNTIKRRTALTLHVLISIIAIVIGFYISWKINLWNLVYVYVLITGLLWFYSSNFKRQLLIGNIIAALMIALVPLATVLYELPPINQIYYETLLALHRDFMILFYWVLGFAIFAFLITLTIEIIKDTEDFEGDMAYGRHSLAIVYGTSITKNTLIGIIVSTIFLIVIAWILFITKKLNLLHLQVISGLYLLVMLVIPYIVLILKIVKAKEKEDWAYAKTIAKAIMIGGILFSLVIRFSYTAYA